MELLAYNLIPGLVLSYNGQLAIVGESVSRDPNLEAVTFRLVVEDELSHDSSDGVTSHHTVLAVRHYCDRMTVLGTAPDLDPEQIQLWESV